MFEPLLPEDYRRIAALIASLGRQHLIVQSLMEGTSPGAIYVDDPAHPQTAFIASAEGRFLLGAPSNSAFNRALRAHLESLFAGERESWEEELVLTCYPDTWADALNTDILPFRPPFISERYYYLWEQPQSQKDWKSRVPAGMRLESIAPPLFEQPTLRNLDALHFWITKDFGSLERYAEQGEGVALIHNDTIVSWSLTDCVWGNHCEIGIETDEAYRRQGLATLVTAAMVEKCLARGWNRIGWHCWHHNLGSIGVAEAVGFRHHATYPSYVSLYDPLMHLAVQGYAALRKEDFATAAHWYGQVAALENAPDWAFYQLARCQAMLQQPDAALASLHHAIDKGFDDADSLNSHPHFAPLRHHPAWQALLSRLA